MPVLVFSHQALIESGVPVMRRANLLAQRLVNRQDWSADWRLPIVAGGEGVSRHVAYNAAPALAPLQHPRTEVRVAALAALEFRKDWRPGRPR